MEDWKVAGIIILGITVAAAIIGITLLTFVSIQNQTAAYQQSYGYNTPYQSAPYPTPAIPDNGPQQTTPTQPPYTQQQPSYPVYPYYPPNYGYGYPYGYGFGEHGFGPWRGMG